MSVSEGSLEAPTRHPLDWLNADFYNKASCEKEMERVFDICHGCRRCVSLCNSFPTLFDLVDASSTFEVDGKDFVGEDKFGSDREAAMPEVFAATIRDIKGFADSL